MDGDPVLKELPVVIKPHKGLAQPGKAQDDLVQAEVKGIEDGVEGENDDEQETRGPE